MPLRDKFEPVQLHLTHRRLGLSQALLREACLADVGTWEREWCPRLNELNRPDGKWPWEEHIKRGTLEDDRVVLALECTSALAGMISIRLAPADSKLTSGADMLYVEYVGVAPPNQPEPVGERMIAGVGTLLVITSLQLSVMLGCDGRVGLHSKPDVEDFYRKRGFDEVGYDQTDDGTWLYFEMSPEGARLQLRQFER